MKRILTVILALQFFCLTALSQSTISGTVKDAKGAAIAGVSVGVKGTSVGTVTDDLGNFRLNAPASAGILVFSYVGYTSQEISVGGKQSVDAILEEDVSNLKGVVVVGYGTQSRETVTGSISKLDNKILQNVPFTNPASALQGALPGVRVQSISGQPGAAPRVIVRGGTSINNPDGASPLYIVDGIIRNDMNNIASDDIESIQVLKDAASTAIYGARGSNGVVIITTKSGKPGKTQINYRYDFGISKQGKTYDLASARDYITLSRLSTVPYPKFAPSNSENLPNGFGTGNDLTNNTAFTTQFLSPENEHKLNEGWESMPDPLDPSKTIIFKETDFQGLAFQTGMSHNHFAEITGGTDKATFNAGIGFMSAEGPIITTKYDRLSFNLNGTIKARDNLSFFGRVMFSNSNKREPASPYAFVSFYRNGSLPPTAKYTFEDGTLAPGDNQYTSNPVYTMNNIRGKNTTQNLTLSAGARWNILPGFSFDPQVSLYNLNEDFWRFQPSFLDGPLALNTSREATSYTSRWRQNQVDGVFSYQKTFGLFHNLNAKAGISYFDREQSVFNAMGRNASTDLIPTLNASAEPVLVNSSITKQVILGYFGRVNYDFDQKYLLSLNMRYDGASNLGADNKWGFFPGVSVGWNVDKENFWSFPAELVNLKLRMSYGVNGNISGL
ncbi:MAG: SusC/RagA family TonB-linked outer membrane protein, partial [Chitinophagaceae bacterium]|nr:SusC/RagA family TonB-linked outer membrane protein [Chitinophagaceae bacterium]